MTVSDGDFGVGQGAGRGAGRGAGGGAGRGAPADLALDALRSGGDGGRPAVSTLSVDEAVALDQVGYHPVGLVTGASVWRVGMLGRAAVGLGDNCELDGLSQAMGSARRTALARLVAAGADARADGVVGVRLDVGDIGSDGRLVHLIATGTAVRLDESRAASPHRGRRPGCFAAACSGQDLHLLVRAGYQPLGIVAGVCGYHVGRRSFDSWASSIKTNQEMTVFTDALYDARELAMGRLQDQALELGADGVVGVTVTERPSVWGSHVIEFAAIGTAVSAPASASAAGRLDPRLVMDLAGERLDVSSGGTMRRA